MPGQVGVSAEMVRVAEAVVARPVGLVAGSVEAQVISDVRDANLVEGYNIMAGRQPDYPAVDKLAQNNIGYKDYRGTQVKTPAETTMYTEVNGINGIIPNLKDYAEKGIDQCSANARNYLIDNYAQVILSSPQQANRFVGMTPTDALTEAKRIAMEHLRNPLIQRQVAENLAKKADITKPIEDKVTPAEAELHRLEQERDRLKDLFDGIDGAKGKYDSKKTEVEAYNQKGDPAHPGAFIEGLKYTELNRERTNRAGYEATISDLNNSVIPGLETEISQLNQEYNSAIEVLKLDHPGVTDANHLAANGFKKTTAQLRAEVMIKQTEMRTKRGELTRAMADEKKSETKITKLEAEKKQYESELKELETKMEKAKEAYDKAKDTSDKQKITRDTLLSDKETAESQWVGQLKGIVPEIAGSDLQTEMQLALNKTKEIMDKRATDEKDANKKRFWSYESQQYISSPDGRPIRNNINADRIRLMRQGALATFNWTENGVNHTETLQLNGAELTLLDVMNRASFTNQEIYTQIKDPAVRTEMSHTLAKDILATYLWSGGRLSQGQWVAIGRSDWGKGMMAEAIAGRADIKAQIDASIGKDVMNWQGDILAQLGKIDWKKLAVILLIIAGVIGGIGLLKK